MTDEYKFEEFLNACKEGNLDVLNKLLEFTQVVEKISDEDNKAFRLAYNKEHLDVVNRLLEFPAVVEKIKADDELNNLLNEHIQFLKNIGWKIENYGVKNEQ